MTTAGRQLALRPMVKTDIARFMTFEEELFGSESWTPDSYRAELADARYRHYIVAELVADAVTETDTADLIGWAGLMVIGETAQILTIGVVPGAQRQGTGQVMLDALLDEARRRGAIEVILEVRVDNGPARRLYERNRFLPLRVRRGYYDLGRVDALELKRVL